jgi:ABC-2 type transport system ATP-binding protein
MMDFAIETFGLTKRFGDVVAVDDVNLRVKKGEIYGFLGLNGAGKTTTIRALLGMIKPSSGEVKVLGQTIKSDNPKLWGRVGHLVENPSAYPELTLQENLEIARRLQAVQDMDAVFQMMERFNISQFANKKAGNLSTGNLQRLALSRAMLHNPELLILDEPSNGLDPAGVVEIRELLLQLAGECNVTIFMSSHILAEVEKLATRIGIIHKGKLIEELDADKLRLLKSSCLKVITKSNTSCLDKLKKQGYSVELKDDFLVIWDKQAIENPEIVSRIVVEEGLELVHLSVAQQNLEEHFLKLISQNNIWEGKR